MLTHAADQTKSCSKETVEGKKKILIADDDFDNFLLTIEAANEAGLNCDYYWVKDGEELVEYLYHKGAHSNPEEAPFPDLVLLDLNMPRKNGHEALEEIKTDPRFMSLPIVVLTVSNAQSDIDKSYRLGAHSFVRKPANFSLLVSFMKALRKYL